MGSLAAVEVVEVVETVEVLTTKVNDVLKDMLNDQPPARRFS